MTDYDEGGEFDGMQEEPRYLLLAREAEMFQTGGFMLAADPQKAGGRPGPVGAQLLVPPVMGCDLCVIPPPRR